MPRVTQIHKNHTWYLSRVKTIGSFVGEVEECCLFLPSNLPPGSPVASPSLRMVEAKLREGQAHDALQEVHNYLCLLAFSHCYQKQNFHGQHKNTCVGTLIKHAESKK